MAVRLLGEIVNSCDSATGFITGAISGDDDFVEGTGAIGVKASNTTTEMYTTTLGATAPYNFSTGGTESGYHIIMWFNTKTPINATSGLRIVVGNGTDRGHWYVTPQGFYKGGFITKVVDSARNFDVIQAGTWTTGGNPAQLSNITQMGGVFTTITSIMGSFNNVQLDQMTIGLGLEITGGTGGSPNTFEEVRAADEDTAFYGWWGSSNGTIVGKGKLYIGTTAGASTFYDVAPSVTFADELVAEDFYEIAINGTGTTCSLELATLASANPDNVRWALNVNSGTFTDINGVWSGTREINLTSNCGLSGTTFINGNKLYQNSATLDGITVLAANTTGGTAFIESDTPANISNSTFEFSSGHAIEITSATTSAFTFSNNSFIGYGASGTTDAAIYNNSGKHIVINITDGGDTPTIRNGSGASTTIINAFTLTLTNLVEDTEVRIYTSGTFTEVGGQESVTGGTFTYAYDYQPNTYVDIVVYKETYVFNEPTGRISNFLLTNSNQTIPINQLYDRNYYNP